MSIFIVILCIALLIVLITWFKINAFLAFLITSITAALLLEVEPSKIGKTLETGVGSMLGGLVIVIIVGAMLGKLVAETGAAQQIASGLMKAFGEKYLQVAMMITGFVIGIPLFYNVAFVLVFPLIASIVYRYKLPAVYVGLPMMAALSVTHGFLPPHPSPVGLVAQLKANMGQTLMYGIVIAIPTVIISGLLFSKTLKHLNPTLPKTFQSEGLPEDKLPSMGNSLFSALLPVILLAITTIFVMAIGENEVKAAAAEGDRISQAILFFSDSNIVMLLSIAIATYTLGLRRGMKMTAIMDIYGGAVKDVALMVLIMGGAGALKEVLTVTGVSKEIASLLNGMNAHPLFLGWLIACIIRVCVGSATVAGLTAAGIVAPLLAEHPEVDANLMVLAVGAGSLMFSHVNDAGFWLFKEYYNLSIKQTIRSWSLMETIVAICGLIGVMALNAFI
ncbi:MAG TPA: gluconate:H+ symporter [Cyclobacteriaceae bacterium]|nr:gluconate:H+ symporter [Cyclobacteriaceae bacterium]